MKKNTCSLCGSSDLYFIKYNQHTGHYPFKQRVKDCIKKILKRGSALFGGNIEICNSCGYGVMEKIPEPEKLRQYYKTQYWGQRAKDEREISKDEYKNDMRAKTQIDFVYDYIKGINHILEIGAGPAFPSLLLRDRIKEESKEVKLFVVEAGKQWIEYYKENSIIPVADFFPFNGEQKFDYIHTSHWLEHVQDLKQTIEILNSMLYTGGYLYVEVPNSSKEYWNLDFKDVPHIHFFTKYSLRKWFENYGFECLNAEEAGVGFSTYFHERRFDYYGQQENGIWIRAIFKKQNDICQS